MQLRSALSPKRGLHVELETLSESTIREAMKSAGSGPSKIGFSRKVERLKTNASVSTALAWSSENDGGSIGHLSIRAPGAKALRVGLHFDLLPEGTELRFHDESLSQIETVTAAEIKTVLDLNAASGDLSPEASVYWSPVIQGETIGLEISLPKGKSPQDIQFRVEGLSHLTLNPALGEKAGSNAIGISDSCNVDSRCYANWSQTSNAVAHISFVYKGSSYLCTGTLLNNAAGDNIPYFLTANHCISTQTTASTLNSYWFYYSTSCNSGSLNPSMSILSQGATLLYAASTTDASFLKLNGTPPAGVTFAGWTNASPPIGALAAGIHNPQGDLQKMNFGVTSESDTCQASAGSGDSFTCSPSNEVNATFVNVLMNTGTTEPGSSGSGIFLESNQFLFGQLYGGTASCSKPSGSNMYGLFSKTYQNGQLAQWLGSAKQSQTINLTLPQTLTVSGVINLNATASSGLPVTLTSSSPSICSITNGTTLTGLAPGTCQVLGTQAGNATYASATASKSLTVTALDPAARNPQSVTLTLPPGIIWGDSAAFTAQASSGLEVTTLSKTPTICEIQNLNIIGLYPGVCTLAASQAGDLSYSPASTESSTQIRPPTYPKPTTKVSVTVKGSGTVRSTPVGISCGVYCSINFSRGREVKLEALASEGKSFYQWQGACTGKLPTCSLTPKGKNQTVTAMFR